MNQVDVGVNKKTKKKKEKKVLSVVYSKYFGRKRRQRLPRFASFISLDIHIKSRARAHRFHEKVHFFFVFYFLYLILIMILAGDGLATTPIDIRSRWSRTDLYSHARGAGPPAALSLANYL